MKENRVFAKYYVHLKDPELHRAMYLPAWPLLWLEQPAFRRVTEMLFHRFNLRALNEQQDIRVIVLAN